MTDPSPERTRPFYPGDNAVPMNEVDWKSRYQELTTTRNWDPEKDFVGIKRLGKSYSPLDPFFKFDGVPEDNKTFDKLWYPFYGFVGFTGAYIAASYWSRRPLFSGLLPALVSGCLGIGVGALAYRNQQSRARDRDAVMIHYLLLHEQDFPKIGISFV